MFVIEILRRRKLGMSSCREAAKYARELFDTPIKVLRNDKGVANEEVVVRWGCTSTLGGNVKAVINPTKHIHRVADKVGCRKLLQEAGVSVPKTIFRDNGVIPGDLFDDGKILIGRRATHSQGRHMKVITTMEELFEDKTSAYWSEYIPKEKEYRVYCGFGRVLAVAEKIAEDKTQIAWNHAQGGSIFHNVKWKDWPREMCMEALRAQKACKIDFTGIDMMVLGDDYYVLELNSAPSLTSVYRQKIFAKFYTWIWNEYQTNETKPTHFDLPKKNNWGSLILPFIKENLETT